MSKANRVFRRPAVIAEAKPFRGAEEVWFWFVQCRSAQQQGARVAAGLGDTPRPCEPLDVLTVVERLHRSRRLSRAHLQVMIEYGHQLVAPDPDVPRERRDAGLWAEAFAVLDPVLRDKGIVA